MRFCARWNAANPAAMDESAMRPNTVHSRQGALVFTSLLIDDEPEPDHDPRDDVHYIHVVIVDARAGAP